MDITSEQLAYWYLRLNGFFTIQNFIVHPDTGNEQRTDADILGVRLPYRAELRPKPMIDDEPFTQVADRPFIIMAEVKRGKCKLNGPWIEPQKENLQRVLRAIGAFPDGEIETIARSVYSSGVFLNKAYHLTLGCFGKTRNPQISRTFPGVPQILWDKVMNFIYTRFRAYHDQKESHGQWDTSGRNLWDCVWTNQNTKEFRQKVIITGK